MNYTTAEHSAEEGAAAVAPGGAETPCHTNVNQPASCREDMGRDLGPGRLTSRLLQLVEDDNVMWVIEVLG